MESLERLYHLQEVELSIRQLRKELNDLEKSLGETEELRQARNAVLKARETLEKAHKEAENLQEGISRADAKAKPVNQKLFGGRIRNPREVEALREQAESIKKHRSGLEDSLLDVMIQIEEWEETLSEREKQLAEVEASWKTDQSEKRTRIKGIEEKLERLGEERSALRSAMPADLLADYDYLATRKGGRAVARVINGACEVCGAVVPRAFLAKMRSGEIVHCGECGRILLG